MKSKVASVARKEEEEKEDRGVGGKEKRGGGEREVCKRCPQKMRQSKIWPLPLTLPAGILFLFLTEIQLTFFGLFSSPYKAHSILSI